MNHTLQNLVNAGVFLGICWGAVRGGLSLYQQYSEITGLPQELKDQQEESSRQLKAIWAKLDHLDKSTDDRLDRIERLIAYIGGNLGQTFEDLDKKND